MNIGLAIDNIRKAKGMTQGELAEKSFITQGALSQIKTGIIIPKWLTICKIAEALDVSPGLLWLNALEAKDAPPGKEEIFKSDWEETRKILGEKYF